MTQKRVNAAWWATVVLFLEHGLVVSTWVSRIPAIKAGLRLPNGIFGLALLSSAFGAVSFITLVGMMISRYGSKIVVVVTGVAFSLCLVPLAIAQNLWTFAASLFIYGAFAAAMDVSMNSQAVEVERELGKPTMSRFHGMFSLGGMAGATLGGIVAAHGINPLTHFAVSAMINAAASIAVIPLLLETHNGAQSGEHRLPFRKMPSVLIALSAIGFCIFLAEGAMADWTAVYLRQNLHAGEGTAAAGYAVFSASMAICRLMGDYITTKLGPMRTVRIASILAGFGLMCALVMHRPEWAMPGYAISGMGFSVIIPLVFGGGGRVKGINSGAGIATVTGIGYVGFIIGPPAIGFVSDLVTLRYALGIVVACCLVSAGLAGYMKALATGAPDEVFPDNPAV